VANGLPNDRLSLRSAPAKILSRHKVTFRWARPWKWSKRAFWSLVVGGIGAIVSWNAAREFGISNKTLLTPIAVLPLNWACVYGSWTFFLWLYRCVTRNRQKKPLWNLRGGWAIVLAFALFIPVTIYFYWDQWPDSPYWIAPALGGGTGTALGLLPVAICGLLPYSFYFETGNALPLA
jgi:hypothetical protein